MQRSVRYIYPHIEKTIDFRIFGEDLSDIVGYHFTKTYEMFDIEGADKPAIYMFFTKDRQVHISYSMEGILGMNYYFQNLLDDYVTWDYCKMFISTDDSFDPGRLKYLVQYYIDRYSIEGSYDVSYDPNDLRALRYERFVELDLVGAIRDINRLMRVEDEDVIKDITLSEVTEHVNEYLEYELLDGDFKKTTNGIDQLFDVHEVEDVTPFGADDDIADLFSFDFELYEDIEADLEDVNHDDGDTPVYDADEMDAYIEQLQANVLKNKTECTSTNVSFYPKGLVFKTKAQLQLTGDDEQPFKLIKGSIVRNPIVDTEMYDSDIYIHYDKVFQEILESNVIEPIDGEMNSYRLVESYCFNALSTVASLIKGQHVNGWNFFDGMDHLRKDYQR